MTDEIKNHAELNMRRFSARKAVGFSLRMLFWLPVIFFSLLLVKNTLPYFTFKLNMPFLLDRIPLYERGLWRWSFYIHIAAGSVCILAALIQFSSWILRRRKKIHIVSGRIYVFVVLLIGAPTGFYMTFFAEGGYAEKICFMLMAIAWFVFTYKGFTTAAIKKDFVAHKYWMIRSYAMALTAVTFRVYHFLFFIAGVNHFQNYSVSLWISVLGNAAIAELIIYLSANNYLKSISV
jgi:hypothetical protein